MHVVFPSLVCSSVDELDEFVHIFIVDGDEMEGEKLGE
jgi:hypothetical protein